MSPLEIALGVATIAAGAVSTYVALMVRPLEKEQADMEKRIQGLHDDVKEERERIERRLADVERSFIARSEMKSELTAMAAAFERGVDRLETGLKEVGVKVDGLAIRVHAVESAQ